MCIRDRHKGARGAFAVHIVTVSTPALVPTHGSVLEPVCSFVSGGGKVGGKNAEF